MASAYKIVYWTCDKLDCRKANYRHLELGDIINTDRCEHCRSNIHEPIVITVNPPIELGLEDDQTEID